MKCNQEQFEAIKPKLKGIVINSVNRFDYYPYLTNTDGNSDTINNITKKGFGYLWRRFENIYETWNERIFLEACGIETEETFEITKETIIKYKMKDEFPEVFKKEEQNGWYKDNTEPKWLGFFENDCLIYGFDTEGDYFNEIHKKGATDSTNDIKATEQEVFEALKNEAVKRGFVKGAMYTNTIGLKNLKVSDLYFGWDGLHSTSGNGMIFKNGIWAEKIVPTKTKEEAEKLLNCKILN